MAYDDSKKAASGASVMLAGRVEIFPSMPLPELNGFGGKAYAAKMKTDATSNLFAIICTSRVPPRIESVLSMKNIDNPAVLRLVEGGVVPWAGGIYAYAFVYHRPTSPRLFLNLDDVHNPLSEDVLHRHFIAPMIGALEAFSNSGLVHNALNPINIFWQIGAAIPPQIGECLSVPPGVGQSILFEPIERAMTMPMGRGPGLHADDCYAFGVTLAFLILGRNPLQGMSDRDIIDIKCQRGSFGALLGNQRVSPVQIEILRALLADDPAQRWTASDLDQWLNGRRMTPKSSDARRRAGRHFVFMEKEYWQTEPLAEAFGSAPEEAAKVIENESLNKWLRRAMNEKDCAKDVEDVVNDLKQSGKTAHYEDQLVARVCLALDPRAPIRYRGLSAMPAGLPTLLVEADQGGGNLQILMEIILSQLPSLWIQMQGENKANYISLGQMFDRMRSVMEKPSFGNGVERAIYESNPGIPCLSPMLRNQYVTAPKFLLAALERVASGGNKGRDPIDRHIAAFLITRSGRSEKMFQALSLPENSIRRGVTLLGIFAELQYKYGPENAPHVAAWLAPVVDPALKRYANKSLRESMHKRAKDCIVSGRITDLLQLVDDPKLLMRDQEEFYAARILYLNIQKELLRLEAKTNNRDSISSAVGKPMAVSISSLLAVIIASAAVLRVMISVFFNR